MDLNKIFMKNATPTKVGGQAVLEGLMMRGSRAMAVAVRRPDGDVHLAVEPLAAPGSWKKWPIVRGVVSFVSSLVTGTRILMYSADVLENCADAEYCFCWYSGKQCSRYGILSISNYDLW